MWWLDPAIVFAKHYLAKFKKPLLISAAAAALFAGGFGAGYLVRGERDAVERAEQAEVAVERVVEEVIVRDEIEREVYVEDLTRVRQLEADLAASRRLVASLQERVDTYVPQTGPGGSDYLTVGAVRLLDSASTGSAPEGLSAVEPDGADTAASDTSWRAFVRHELEVRGLYNQCRVQANALIQWVEDNVVNQPGQ